MQVNQFLVKRDSNDAVVGFISSATMPQRTHHREIDEEIRDSAAASVHAEGGGQRVYVEGAGSLGLTLLDTLQTVSNPDINLTYYLTDLQLRSYILHKKVSEGEAHVRIVVNSQGDPQLIFFRDRFYNISELHAFLRNPKSSSINKNEALMKDIREACETFKARKTQIQEAERIVAKSSDSNDQWFVEQVDRFTPALDPFIKAGTVVTREMDLTNIQDEIPSEIHYFRMMNVLAYILDPDEKRKIFESVLKRLAPGGRFYYNKSIEQAPLFVERDVKDPALYYMGNTVQAVSENDRRSHLMNLESALSAMAGFNITELRRRILSFERGA